MPNATPVPRVAVASCRSMISTWARLLVVSLLCVACSKAGPPTTPPDAAAADPLAGKPVVLNVDAKPGDVTVCPYSGRKFVVTDDSPRWEYQGKSYVFCSAKAVGEVQKDPAKYMDGFGG
jgi:YHS domain-containing protein